MRVSRRKQRGFLMNAFQWGSTPAPLATDPYYANVSLLLHGNGTNGSTLFTDDSSAHRNVSPVGGAGITTAVKQFGTGALSFDGVNDYATLAASDAFSFGLADFTIESFIYLRTNADASGKIVLDMRINGPDQAPSLGILNLGAGNYFYAYTGIADIQWNSALIALNTWYYVCLRRTSGVWTLQVNTMYPTISSGSSAAANANFSTNKPLRIAIAQDLASAPADMVMEELRITKGISRPDNGIPTEAFPNAGPV